MSHTDQLFREIAKQLGVPLWIDLTDEVRSNIIKHGRDSAPSDYFECKHNASRETLEVVHFDPFDMYSFPLMYSLDLNTMKPTRDCSLNTAILSEDLCDKIRAIYPVVKWFYADETTDRETVELALTNGYTVRMKKR